MNFVCGATLMITRVKVKECDKIIHIVEETEGVSLVAKGIVVHTLVTSRGSGLRCAGEVSGACRDEAEEAEVNGMAAVAALTLC